MPTQQHVLAFFKFYNASTLSPMQGLNKLFLSLKYTNQEKSVRDRKKRHIYFDRLSPHQSVFSVNRRFSVEGLRAETGISPNQPYTPWLSINIKTSS